MRADQMVPGKIYKLNKRVIEVEVKFRKALNSVIVHPPGERDMQSSFGIEPGTPVKEVARLAEVGTCPCCSTEIDPIPAGHSESKNWTHWCGSCYWMGNSK